MAVGGANTRDQALSLLAAANNHGDLAVKLSSLKQVKGILFSSPSLCAELFPFLVELQSSPESLVRKTLIEVVEETGLNSMEHSVLLMPALLASLKDFDSVVASQAIVSGIHFFCSMLEELTLQFQRHRRVENWTEELWAWMVKFKDAVFAIALEPGSIKTKLLAMKFMEMCVLLFSHDTSATDKFSAEGNGQAFNISWLDDGHPVLEPLWLNSEVKRTFGILMNFLRTASSLPGPLTVFAVNCLAAIARKRPIYYSTVLSALLDFDPNFEMVSGGHAASTHYSIRTAFLGFLRCMHPVILESRDRLLRGLRSMNAGDAADQVIRQVDKMMKNNERTLRDARKDDQSSSQQISGDSSRKRSMLQDLEEPSNGYELASKRIRYGHNNYSTAPVQMVDSGQDDVSMNGASLKVPLLDGDLTPVEQMIAMICALLAEGERGAESLEILVSNIHPDVLADIVINNMKHLPSNPPPLTRIVNLPVSRQIGSSNSTSQVVAPTAPTHPIPSVQVPLSPVTATSAPPSEVPMNINLPADSKRDPRRDPRRLDPRRVVETIKTSPVPVSEESAMQSDFDDSNLLSRPSLLPPMVGVENSSVPMMPKNETDDLESSLVSGMDQSIPIKEALDEAKDYLPIPEVDTSSEHVLPSDNKLDEDSPEPKPSEITVVDLADTLSPMEFDQHSPDVSGTPTSEEASQDLPLLPPYVDLTEEQQRNVSNLAFERIVEFYKHLAGPDCIKTRMELLARLVAQSEADGDVVVMLQKHVCSDYQNHKGHELVLHVLYHLHTVIMSDSVERSSYAAVTYEKVLLAVANSLLETLPASDKAFSRLLGEVPFLPDSALKLLDDLCYSTDHQGKVARDVDRVTQGLGAVWSLILGRPPNRQACLNIALKCAVHSQDDIRAKAIRLVANKLYLLTYVSENIEEYATKMLLSAVDQRAADIDPSQSRLPSEQKTEGEVGSQETSISSSQISEPGIMEYDSMKGAQLSLQGPSTKSSQDAQRFISLFFALCTKKPSLLQLVFDIYGRAPKAVRQAVHRHIPILIRSLGSSCSELLRVISDPPQGSENLLSVVLQILTEDKAPPSDLIATVKHLYQTKLKDASILIPVLSSLSKNEVLPIFPRLVNLPLEKFQKALAYILQGSAHTGPALTPAEVLVAIHDIMPEKDGIPLKKITDACSACFEQRIVFTQQVLAKALNQMVDQTPLPLLFMRTIIQAIDAYPTLVDFVMEILSKLVRKQVWRMPKLWVGFLKCISQTQPHSFHVLLQLPPPQLESALNRHASLKGPLTAYASHPSVKPSLSRSTLVVLGLVNESHMEQPHVTSLHPMDASSSVHGATLT